MYVRSTFVADVGASYGWPGNARELVETYCALLYQRHGTYEKVASIAKLDRRTVKRAIVEADKKLLLD